MIEYLKEETDELILQKLPVRVIYRDGDKLHVAWATTPTGDQERFLSDDFFADDEVVFEAAR